VGWICSWYEHTGVIINLLLTMGEKRFLVFIIWGYDELIKSTGSVTNYVEFQLIDTNYESALKRAKKIYKKNGYLLKTVIENFKK